MSPPSPLKLFPGGHIQAQHHPRQKKATLVARGDSVFAFLFNNFNFGKPKAESNVCFLYGEYTESRAETQGVIFTFAWVFERVVPSRW